ncbi:hypothetical protein NDU88_005841 [Pleurodeles waltl]|uniref:Uncharacterized protein n=1 Tax=Pleurodeles waltl TaxID=8319 RepID=A0AAV7LM97_PLEWA|nr:hypothetical protein NDU88_005841 [Pleurodeles waltl]
MEGGFHSDLSTSMTPHDREIESMEESLGAARKSLSLFTPKELPFKMAAVVTNGIPQESGEGPIGKQSGATAHLQNICARESDLDIIIMPWEPQPSPHAGKILHVEDIDSPPNKRKIAGPRQVHASNTIGRKHTDLDRLASSAGAYESKGQPQHIELTRETRGEKVQEEAGGLEAALEKALNPLAMALKSIDKSQKEFLAHVKSKLPEIPRENIGLHCYVGSEPSMQSGTRDITEKSVSSQVILVNQNPAVNP